MLSVKLKLKAIVKYDEIAYTMWCVNIGFRVAKVRATLEK